LSLRVAEEAYVLAEATGADQDGSKRPAGELEDRLCADDCDSKESARAVATRPDSAVGDGGFAGKAEKARRNMLNSVLAPDSL
jgi:hypothetical protein